MKRTLFQIRTLSLALFLLFVASGSTLSFAKPPKVEGPVSSLQLNSIKWMTAQCVELNKANEQSDKNGRPCKWYLGQSRYDDYRKCLWEQVEGLDAFEALSTEPEPSRIVYAIWYKCTNDFRGKAIAQDQEIIEAQKDLSTCLNKQSAGELPFDALTSLVFSCLSPRPRIFQDKKLRSQELTTKRVDWKECASIPSAQPKEAWWGESWNDEKHDMAVTLLEKRMLEIGEVEAAYTDQGLELIINQNKILAKFQNEEGALFYQSCVDQRIHLVVSKQGKYFCRRLPTQYSVCVNALQLIAREAKDEE